MTKVASTSMGNHPCRAGPAPAVQAAARAVARAAHIGLFVIQSALTSACRAPLCSSERQR